ncbi:hypothetical protein [Microbulbifer halophilus]
MVNHLALMNQCGAPRRGTSANFGRQRSRADKIRRGFSVAVGAGTIGDQ